MDLHHGGLWYLICTPGDDHVDLDMLRHLVEKLHEADLDELIFVLLMVHRDHPALRQIPEYLLLRKLSVRWQDDRGTDRGRPGRTTDVKPGTLVFSVPGRAYFRNSMIWSRSTAAYSNSIMRAASRMAFSSLAISLSFSARVIFTPALPLTS